MKLGRYINPEKEAESQRYGFTYESGYRAGYQKGFTGDKSNFFIRFTSAWYGNKDGYNACRDEHFMSR